MDDLAEEEQASALFDRVSMLANNKRWTEAEEAARKISPDRPMWRVDALHIIARRLIDADRHRQAHEVGHESVSVIQSIANDASRAGLLADSADIFAATDDLAEAKRLWIAAGEAASLGQTDGDEQDRVDSAKILRAISRSLALAGEPVIARTFAQRIVVEVLRQAALRQIEESTPRS